MERERCKWCDVNPVYDDDLCESCYGHREEQNAEFFIVVSKIKNHLRSREWASRSYESRIQFLESAPDRVLVAVADVLGSPPNDSKDAAIDFIVNYSKNRILEN